MPQVNLSKSGHTGPATVAGWQWLTYTDDDFIETLNRAIHIIEARIKSDDT
jgi:hypothetical protein